VNFDEFGQAKTGRIHNLDDVVHGSAKRHLWPRARRPRSCWSWQLLVDRKKLRESMISRGIPPEISGGMLGYLADNVQQPGPSSDMVQEILGRPALTVEARVATQKADFE
jgi:hypothetical protein